MDTNVEKNTHQLLPLEAIEEFKNIYLVKYNRKLSDKQAKSLAEKTFLLHKPIYKAIKINYETK